MSGSAKAVPPRPLKVHRLPLFALGVQVGTVEVDEERVVEALAAGYGFSLPHVLKEFRKAITSNGALSVDEILWEIITRPPRYLETRNGRELVPHAPRKRGRPAKPNNIESALKAHALTARLPGVDVVKIAKKLDVKPSSVRRVNRLRKARGGQQS